MATALFVHQPYDPTVWRRPTRWTTRAAELPPPTWTERRGGEADLVRIVADVFGGYAGSLPSERVQNVVKTRYPRLYASVIDADPYRRRWNAFLRAHPAVFGLAQVPGPIHPDEPSWRLYLAANEGRWRDTDAASVAAHARADAEHRDALAAALAGAAGAAVGLRELAERCPTLRDARLRYLQTLLRTDPAARFLVDCDTLRVRLAPAPPAPEAPDAAA